MVDVLIQLDDIICTPNDWLADDQSDYRRSLLNQLIGVPQGGKELTVSVRSLDVASST